MQREAAIEVIDEILMIYTVVCFHIGKWGDKR